ncbi:MAG: 30S ribosomal protein S19e [Nanoarchaeota archaeon]|nr:30S ribosomal protein S19e [Nanoarchaeota archaeon]
MVKIYDVDPGKLIKKLAEELKKVELIIAPEWAKFVKTGTGKERPPKEKDWWYLRAASVMRKIYVNGPLGVSKLRKKYSSKKNRGHKPDRVYVGSGNILRKILQQLEKAELLKYVEKGVHKGRIVTGKGEKLLNQVAKELGKVEESVKEEIKKVEKVPEKKPVIEKPKEPSLEKNVHEEKKEIKKLIIEKPKETKEKISGGEDES